MGCNCFGCLFFPLPGCQLCCHRARNVLRDGIQSTPYTFLGEVYTPEDACRMAGGTVAGGRCEHVNAAKACEVFSGSWNASDKQCQCEPGADMCVYIGGINNGDGSCTINPHTVKPEICTGTFDGNYANGQCYLPGQLALVDRGAELLVEGGENLLIGRGEGVGEAMSIGVDDKLFEHLASFSGCVLLGLFIIVVSGVTYKALSDKKMVKDPSVIYVKGSYTDKVGGKESQGS